MFGREQIVQNLLFAWPEVRTQMCRVFSKADTAQPHTGAGSLLDRDAVRRLYCTQHAQPEGSSPKPAQQAAWRRLRWLRQ